MRAPFVFSILWAAGMVAFPPSFVTRIDDILVWILKDWTEQPTQKAQSPVAYFFGDAFLPKLHMERFRGS